jgi:hypothetical protein
VTIFVKDPTALLDYAIDWTAGYLGELVITGSQWRVAPAGDGAITVVVDRIDTDRTVATLSGGLVGCLYHVTNTVIFSDGRSDERKLVVRVEAR